MRKVTLVKIHESGPLGIPETAIFVSVSAILGSFGGFLTPQSIFLFRIRTFAPRIVCQTAPWVGNKFTALSSHQSGSGRIEVNIIRYDTKIIRTFHSRAHRHGFITPLKDMSSPRPPCVPSLAECPK